MSKRRAFTLVELLVVIGIIALLVSILLPSLNRARLSASNLRCLSNLRQMGTAIHMYANAHDGKLPFGYWAGNTEWTRLILPYISDRSGQYGPTDDYWRTQTVTIFNDTDTVKATYSAADFNPLNVLHYSVHPRLMPSLTDPPPFNRPYKLSQVRRSSDIVLVLDSPQFGNHWAAGVWSATATAFSLQQPHYGMPNSPLREFYGSTSVNANGPHPGMNRDWANFMGGWEGNIAQIRWRHMNNSVGNFLMVDGHARSMRYARPEHGGSELEWKHLLLDPH
jgi:prepilin-type N-terminal cleavage/methylation domain-containing protein/prepilin-type processing-associated H-X9-DG protein